MPTKLGTSVGARPLEALGELHLLELLLLQDEGQLCQEDGRREGAIGVNAVHVLQSHLLLVLAEATNIGIGGDGVALLHRLADGDDDVGTREALLDLGGAVLLCDGDLEVLDGGDRARGGCEELVVVAEVALGVDLATAAIATESEGILVEVDVLLGVWVRGQDGQGHGLVSAARHGPGDDNVGQLLAVLRPSEALHFLLEGLWQTVLGRELPALWHDGDGAHVHGALLTARDGLHTLLVLGRDLDGSLEDGIRQHLRGHSDVDALGREVAVGARKLTGGLLRICIVLLGEDGVGHGGVRYLACKEHRGGNAARGPLGQCLKLLAFRVGAECHGCRRGSRSRARAARAARRTKREAQGRRGEAAAESGGAPAAGSRGLLGRGWRGGVAKGRAAHGGRCRQEGS
mmetsp:Transcript_7896/g.25131  ORF Transcript_7896/g.25131 Transcript_7896/m.25131 type:complete len:403 (+) Transcript_7896:139-1347(+)